MSQNAIVMNYFWVRGALWNWSGPPMGQYVAFFWETIFMRKKCMDSEMQIPICLAIFQTSPENLRCIHKTGYLKGNNNETVANFIHRSLRNDHYQPLSSITEGDLRQPEHNIFLKNTHGI